MQEDWSPSISDINSPIDSGILSPAEYLLSPREGSPFSDDFKVDTRESGIGSGADSVSVLISPKRNAGVQTDQLPPEFAHIQQGELKALEDLKKALVEAYAQPGLSLIHVPVYHGPNPLGGMGAYGSWNVGNWCEEVQQKYIETMI